MSKDFYTTHEVSRICRVYPTTVINWIKEGILPAYTTPGGHRRIKRSYLLELMKRHKMPIPEELSREGKKRILIVDDDPKILRMISTVLSAEDDLEVLTAKSGFEAGLLISSWMPDLVLLDFLMPEIDGFEVCRRLKSDEMTKNIPIVAVTVIKDPKEIKRMFSAGVTDYISKPFDSEELVKKIKAICSSE